MSAYKSNVSNAVRAKAELTVDLSKVQQSCQKRIDMYEGHTLSRLQEAFDTTIKGTAATGPAARYAKALCLQATLCDRDDVHDL